METRIDFISRHTFCGGEFRQEETENGPMIVCSCMDESEDG